MATTSTHPIDFLAFSQAVPSGAKSVCAVSSVANHPAGFHQVKAKCAVVTLPEGASSARDEGRGGEVEVVTQVPV